MTDQQLLAIVAAVLHAGRRIELEMSGQSYGDDAQGKEDPPWNESIKRAEKLIAKVLAG